MCGIFALLNVVMTEELFPNVSKEFKKGKKRGPEFSKITEIAPRTIFGFHRLAINGLNDNSNQPLCIQDYALICNGEIYNYKLLYELLNITPETDSDCEVIIHMYKKYGLEQTLTMLDGVFSFMLYDNCNKEIYVARDPFGVRPLYQYSDNKANIAFASEVKSLSDLYGCVNTKEYIIDSSKYFIKQFKPGTYTKIIYADDISQWSYKRSNVPYHINSFSYNIIDYELHFDIEHIYNNISKYLNSAVIKRCITTERPIACLLSGGLDSSLISALTANYYRSQNIDKKLETYSIGLLGSSDLKYAKIVADYIGSNHTEIVVTEDEMFKTIPEVIYAVETYDVTTIRASLGNYLIGKYIKNNSNAKVIMNGDGSDELFGGYLYMKKCPDDIEFDKETRRLLSDIHMYDVLRSDKSISSNGLEPRTPFLDRTLVNYCLSVPPSIRNHNNIDTCEKSLLRNSFTKINFKNIDGKQLLPDEVLWRSKEAFSDGVSSKENSLFDILQKRISEELMLQNVYSFTNTKKMNNMYPVNIDTEKLYYKQIYDRYFPNCENMIQYYWMPKYTNSDKNDPSARTLKIYDNNK